MCCILTSVLIECAANPSQQGQSDQITQTGSNWGGYVVRVDPHLPGTNDNSDHDQTYGHNIGDRLRVDMEQMHNKWIAASLCTTRWSHCSTQSQFEVA